MNRDELIGKYEEALVQLVRQTPCVHCGGDVYHATQNVTMMARFIYELAERWKTAPNMSIAKAAKVARKNMERHFNKLSIEETQRLLRLKQEAQRQPIDGKEVMPEEKLSKDQEQTSVGHTEVGGIPDEPPASPVEEEKSEDRKVSEDDSSGAGETAEETGGEA